jgi:phosphoribosylformylglycinamidine (FGAM) synthase-like enzyme
MCIEGGLGASVEAEQIPAKTRQIDELLFSESHGRFILEVNRKTVKKIMKSLEGQGLPVACIGQVDDGSHLRLKYGGKTLVDLSVPEMKQRWAEAIPRLMGDIV